MLTAAEVAALIDAGESLDVEFKGESRSPLSDVDLVENVACLANRPGDEVGVLLVGVEDDGSVTGARPRHGASTDSLRLQALIANTTVPALSCAVTVVTVRGSDVLAIEVHPSRTPVGTRSGVFKRRAIGGRGTPECLPFHFYEMQAAIADRGALDFSATAVPDATWDDLDPLEFERYRRAIHESRGRGDQALLELGDLELAKTLGAVNANHTVREVLLLGLLLFGREEAISRLVPTHEVAFQAIDGTKVETNEFFRWPLLRVMDELLQRFRGRVREREVMVGLLRIGIPDFPEAAFREALANALIHRAFPRLGAVHVQWHSDRLEISSPGGLPEGVNLDNLLATPPRPRNPRLADAFKRAGIVERTGRGVDTIFFEQLRNGRPAPSYERTTSTDVVVSLPGGAPSLEFVRLVVEENQQNRPLQLFDLLVLNALHNERSLTTQDVSGVIQQPDGVARNVLGRLVEAGLVESRGERKGRSYHLSADTYRRLGEHAAYVRMRGFEPLQQEQMIIQYVETHGQITRREAADLCKLGPDQASRVLRALVDKGRLRLLGERRWARYELAE